MQRIRQRPQLPRLREFAVPALVELLRREPQPLRDAGSHLGPYLDRPVGERVPEIEDHRAYRCSTSQARRTSSSVVRALPIASRRTNGPFRRVPERKTSPPAFTRSRSASFSSSEPDRKSTRLISSHGSSAYAVFCLKQK